jgi:hypothetical protein
MDTPENDNEDNDESFRTTDGNKTKAKKPVTAKNAVNKVESTKVIK